MDEDQEQSELNGDSIQNEDSDHSQAHHNMNQKTQQVVDEKPENKKTLKQFAKADNVGKNKMDEYQKGMQSTDK